MIKLTLDFFPTATAPTSFEGNYGRIIYRVRAFIDTPRFAKDYNTEKAFYLLRLLNLNEVPDIWVRHVNVYIWSNLRPIEKSDLGVQSVVLVVVCVYPFAKPFVYSAAYYIRLVSSGIVGWILYVVVDRSSVNGTMSDVFV